MRQISLQNHNKERIRLTGERGIYASSLAGLGFTMTPVFADLNRGFFIPVSDENEPQNTVPFTITFTQNPYQVYKQFADWINTAKTLTIVYSPFGSLEYCRDVCVNFLQKGELNAVGWLEVPCSFYCITPWYLPSPTQLNLESTGIDESKRYDYYYTESFRYGTDSSASLMETIAGAGHIPGSLELRYHGAITNPRIRLTGDVSGRTYGICSVSAVFLASDTLAVSTRYEESYVKRISADGLETDLLDALDLSTTPFFHIPIDEPCTLSIEADAPFVGAADMLVYYYYRSV